VREITIIINEDSDLMSFFGKYDDEHIIEDGKIFHREENGPEGETWITLSPCNHNIKVTDRQL
jgi:hypothetical protein